MLPPAQGGTGPPTGQRAGWGSGWKEAAEAAPSVPSFLPARLIQHTKDLMETEEKLCVKVLRTLQQMLVKKTKYGERVSARVGRQGQGPGAGTRLSAVRW